VRLFDERSFEFRCHPPAIPIHSGYAQADFVKTLAGERSYVNLIIVKLFVQLGITLDSLSRCADSGAQTVVVVVVVTTWKICSNHFFKFLIQITALE